MALISCEDVSFAYEGNVAAEKINFILSAGDYLCIVGENGSGKSTLIKGLLGLKQPGGGEIRFSENIKRREIGYLPQQTAAQKDFPASAYEIILSGRLNSQGILPFYTRRDKESADEIIERLGIVDIKNRCYRELSGGQQQRVLLARALCATKRLLFLDEPAAGLDPIVTQEFYRLIEMFNRESKLTVIMVSHDIGMAVKYASHILHMKKSQVFFGETKDYLESEMGKRFLGGSHND